MKHSLKILVIILAVCLICFNSSKNTFAIDMKNHKDVVGVETAGVAGASDDKINYISNCNSKACIKIMKSINSIENSIEEDQKKIINLALDINNSKIQKLNSLLVKKDNEIKMTLISSDKSNQLLNLDTLKEEKKSIEKQIVNIAKKDKPEINSLVINIEKNKDKLKSLIEEYKSAAAEQKNDLNNSDDDIKLQTNPNPKF